jgi:hypothetical protein
MLAILLLICSTGCSTTSNTQAPETPISIPVITAPIAKPVLEPIPQMDTSGLTETQSTELSQVLATYNRNMLRLIGYSIRLGGYADASEEYITAINDALKEL